jgi:hypothetical protein
MSQQIPQQHFRRVGEWECLVLERIRGDDYHVITAASINIRVKKDDLQPYPAYVMAKSDFHGGQRHEVFRIRNPLEALVGAALEVVTTVGEERVVSLPIWLAVATDEPAHLRERTAV